MLRGFNGIILEFNQYKLWYKGISWGSDGIDTQKYDGWVCLKRGCPPNSYG
jgi:hypothetical protein